MYASACAVARAFPLYSRKANSQDNVKSTISVEFVIVNKDTCAENLDSQLSDDDLRCIDNAATGVRLAAKIVDAPCNEMTVDDFLNVKFSCRVVVDVTWFIYCI